MCFSIVLAAGALLALTLAWQGLAKGRVELTSTKALQGTGASIVGIICLILGIAFGVAAIGVLLISVMAEADRLAA